MNNNDISKSLKEYRVLRGLTQQELAELLDTSPNIVEKIEDGILKPTMNELVAICNALNCETMEIIRDTNTYETEESTRILTLPVIKQARDSSLVKRYINAFYNVFYNKGSNCFRGSKDQMRVQVQESLNCFVEQSYINETLKMFIKFKIVRKHRASTPTLYTLEKLNYINNWLEILGVAFDDITNNVHDLASREDVQSLLNIAMEYGRDIKDIVQRKKLLCQKVSFNIDYSFEGMLRDFSKAEIYEIKDDIIKGKYL